MTIGVDTGRGGGGAKKGPAPSLLGLGLSWDLRQTFGKFGGWVGNMIEETARKFKVLDTLTPSFACQYIFTQKVNVPHSGILATPPPMTRLSKLFLMKRRDQQEVLHSH